MQSRHFIKVSVLLIMAALIAWVAAAPVSAAPDLEPAAFDCGGVGEIPAAECQALVTLYTGTGGSGWANRTDWLATATPCTGWTGIECSAGHVRALFLPFNGLEGVIPPALADLTELEELDLSGNQLSGSIPSVLGNLDRLAYLYLASNQLSGNLTPELGNLANLRELDLSDNPLSGPLPDSLRHLSLSDFRYDGTGLCEPADSTFQAWLAGIEDLRPTGVTCGATTLYLYLPAVER